MSTVFDVQGLRMNGNFSWLPSTNFLCAATANNQEWSVDLINTTTFAGSTWSVWSDKNSRNVLSVKGDTERVGIGLLANTPTLTLDVGGETRIQAASSCNILTIQTTLTASEQFSGIQLGVPSGQGVSLVSRTRTGNITDFGIITTAGASTSNVSLYVAGQSNFTGIGNNNPQFRLDVSGTTRVVGTGTPFNGLIIQNTGGGGSPLTNGAAINFRGYNMTTGWTARIRSGDGTNGQSGGTLMFSTKTASGTDTDTLAEAMRITETQNVGIGTTAPSTRLQVNGTTSTTSLELKGTKTSWIDGSIMLNNALSTASSSQGYFIGRGFSTATQNHLVIHSDSVVASAGVNFMTNGETSRMFINSTNGRVGIGTLTPSYILDVNGTMRINTTNNLHNKLIVLWDANSTESVSTGTEFYGFGINGSTLRYQTELADKRHSFFCGTTEYFRISNAGQANPSDRRLKSNIKDITDALNKIALLKGKTFNFQGDDKRQMGFIAQEIVDIIPEVVRKDDGDEGLYFLSYDKLTALLAEGIKELDIKLKEKDDEIQHLHNRIDNITSFLQNKFSTEFSDTV
jgi:hypothetical protein